MPEIPTIPLTEPLEAFKAELQKTLAQRQRLERFFMAGKEIK